MREIKFRAWSITEQKMYPAWLCRNETVEFGEKGFSSSSNGFHFMQFTGLKDMNGKEIYEGDILVFRKAIKERNINKPFVVEFELGCFAAGEFIGYEFDGAEVIGNIYENPELLKREKES